MKITVLGSGTSTGIPEIGCDCAVCTDAKTPGSKNNRTRASIMVEFDGHTVVIDTSSDFREQMLRENVHKVDAILLTHMHRDHIGGLDDIRPFNYRHKMEIPCYASQETAEKVRQVFWYIFEDHHLGSTRPSIQLHTIDGPFELFGKKIIPLPVKHGTMDVFGFRMDDFAYVTDYNVMPQETKDLLRGVNTIIIDGLRSENGRPHATHATFELSIAIAQELGISQVYFTHMGHFVDHRNQKLEIGELVYDGQVIEV